VTERMLSLRARLLALQVVVFGALILLASPLTYFIMSRTFQKDRDDYLSAMARNLSQEYTETAETGAPPADLPPRCLPDPVPPGSPDPEATHRPRHLLVCDESGRVLSSDGEWTPLAPEAVNLAARTMQPAFADVRWSAEILRVIALPFRDRSGRLLVMEVGTSYMVIERTLGKSLIAMGVIDLVALLFLVAGSYLLTRGAFGPIDQIIRRVEQIDEDNLAERLPLEERRDEVGRLIIVINHMLERLEHAFEAQNRFSSDVAHEIRSPLTALRGQIEVALRKERPPEEYRRVMKESLEETLRLSRLAEDLMSLAKADAGVLQVRREDMDLRESLYVVLARFRPLAEEKNIQLTLHASESAAVHGDPDLIERLFENIVDNALIHTPPTGEVRVGMEKSGGWVSVYIEDTGSGIPAEELPMIFHRFYRVDPARSRDRGGTGLGLAIARQFAALHGGSIKVRSEIGKGSVFSVTIPLARGAG